MEPLCATTGNAQHVQPRPSRQKKKEREKEGEGLCAGVEVGESWNRDKVISSLLRGARFACCLASGPAKPPFPPSLRLSILLSLLLSFLLRSPHFSSSCFVFRVFVLWVFCFFFLAYFIVPCGNDTRLVGKKATLTNPSVGRLTLDPGWMHDTGLFIAKPATPGALRDFSITVKIEGKGEVGVGVGVGG